MDPAVRLMVVAFAAVRLLGMSYGGPTSYPDTSTYRVKDHWLDFSVSSLWGRSVRPWGVTVWLALWPSDHVIVVAQTLLSVLAWSALALTVARGIARPALRRVMVLVLLVLASTAQVAGWDLAIIAESVSISAGILALAAAIRFARAPSWTRGGIFLAAALWFSMTRPNVFPTLLAWAVAFAVVGLARREILLWGAVAGLLVVFSVYSYVYNLRSDPAWRDASGVTRTTVAYGYPVSANDPVGDAVLRDFRKSDAPRCMIPDYPEQVSDHGTTAWVVKTAKACPGMDAWATAHWSSWWSHWLLTHPADMLRIVRFELPSSLSPPVWTPIASAVPDSVSSVYFGSAAIPQSVIATRSYRTEPALLWVALVVALAWLGRRRWRGSPWVEDIILVAAVAGTLTSAVSSGLLIQTAAFEVGRESAGAAVLMTAALVVLVGCGVDRLMGGRSDDRSSE